MEYTQWVEMQQNPNSNLSTVPAANHSHLVSNPYQQPAFDPHNALFLPQPQPQPPGVDPPYVPPQYVPPPATVNYAQQPIGYEPQQSFDAATAASAAAAAYYYPDPNVNWAAAYPQAGAVNYAAPQAIPAPNLTNQLQKRHTGKKGPKKTKVVQSAWCEVCKIDCNSKGVLDQHKLGKKHLKNLEKLKAKLAPAPALALTVTATTPAVIVDPTVVVAAPPGAVAASTSIPGSAIAVAAPPAAAPVAPAADTPIIGPAENPEKSNGTKSRKRSAARTENLETKKSRVLAGGADAGSVRACNICNVVCNSDTVFNYHLAGKIHASMVKKHALKTGPAVVPM